MTRPVVVMGVAGSGKTTVGVALADALNVEFEDADRLHSPENVAKMSAGIPLGDADRWPWLDRVGEWLSDHADGGVIACSALRRTYRDALRRHAPETVFLALDCDPDVIASRVAHRADHFMPESLVASQLATLEPLGVDETGASFDCEAPVGDIVAGFVSTLPQ